jgi:DNA-binding GntR family transcriptional regulator
VAAALTLDLDRSSPVPLYHQVARAIEAAIEAGTLGPGERLENEVELADRLGLSRPTMRRAIQELVGKGLLVRRRGVGTQVVHARVQRRMGLTSLFDDLSGADQQPSTKVLLHELVAADAEVTERLGLRLGEDVVHLERLRLVRGAPLALMENWLPPDLAPFGTEELEERGLYALLRGRGVRFAVAGQRIGAAAASPAQAKLLGLRRGAPLLTMQRTAYDDSGRAVELGRHAYRADQYSFDFSLVEG